MKMKSQVVMIWRFLSALISRSVTLACNSCIPDIQKSEQFSIMKINEINESISTSIVSGELNNNDLVQIIELCGSYLNLRTISHYAKTEGLSYNGVKNFRSSVVLFGKKFIIDND